MNQQLTKSIESDIDRIASLINQGVQAWIEAGKIVANAIDKDPDFAEKLNAKHPEVSVEMVYALDRVGRRELHPKLLLSEYPGVRRLRRLPYSLQEKYVNNPVPVLVNGPKGWESLQVDINNLTPQQAAQVFDKNGVRSDAAQRAYIESQKAKQPAKEYKDPCRVVGHRLVIAQPCEITAKELSHFLAQMV